MSNSILKSLIGELIESYLEESYEDDLIESSDINENNDDDERLKRAASGKYKPYETNIRNFKILKKGDIISSNDSMHGIFLGQEGDMLKIKTVKGTVMKISKTNKIDWFG